MNASHPEYQDTPAYAARWIMAYVLIAIFAFQIASLPSPADFTATRNPSSWANR